MDVDELDYDIETVEDPGISPGEVLAKLRTYTPDRPCFLLESRSGDEDQGRYSIVGYRVRHGGMIPPGRDAPAGLLAEYKVKERPASFAEAMGNAEIGVLSSSNGTLKQRVQLFEDEGAGATVMHGASVMVWDHRENVVTVAGMKAGTQCERLGWELANGPDVAAVKAIDSAARPANVKTLLTPAQLEGRAKRAMAFVGDEVERVVLGNLSYVDAGESDPLDAYRAWFADSGAKHGYFLDFGTSPAAPSSIVFGVTDQAAVVRRDGKGRSLSDLIYEMIPSPRLSGEPLKMALKLIRRLEDTAHNTWGGVAGYILPGGDGAFVLCDRVVHVTDGAYWHWHGASITADTDPSSVFDAVNAEGGEALAAIATVL